MRPSGANDVQVGETGQPMRLRHLGVIVGPTVSGVGGKSLPFKCVYSLILPLRHDWGRGRVEGKRRFVWNATCHPKIIYPPETNIAPARKPSQKET